MSLPILLVVLVPDPTECLQRVSALFRVSGGWYHRKLTEFLVHDVCADTRPSDADLSLRQHLWVLFLCKRVTCLKNPGCEVQEGRLPVSFRRHGPSSVSLHKSRMRSGGTI